MQGRHTDQELPLHLSSIECTHSKHKDTERESQKVRILFVVSWELNEVQQPAVKFNAGIHPLSFSSMSSVLLHQLSGLKDPGGWPANLPLFFFLIVLAGCVGHDKLARGAMESCMAIHFFETV